MGTMEAVFQAAIIGSHKILILPILENEFGISVNAQIMLYNCFIIKYSHKFEKIIIAIPEYYGKDVIDNVNNFLFKPQDIVKSIDDKYKKEKFINNIQKNY